MKGATVGATMGLLLLTACPSWAGYQYYFSDSLKLMDSVRWNASGVLAPGVAGLTASDSNGGSLISRLPIPDGSSDAEVAITLTLTTSGGTYTGFLQSSPDARTGNASAGSYVALEMQNPQFDAAHKYCSANFVVLQSVNGSVNLLAGFQHSCRNGMRLRMAIHDGTLLVWPDQPQPMEFHIGAAGAGQPGIGSYGDPAGNAISLVQLGAIDRVAPAAVDVRKLSAAVFRTRVDLKWAEAATTPTALGRRAIGCIAMGSTWDGRLPPGSATKP